MTPGILVVKKAGISFIIHEYDHDPSCPSYGMEAAEKLGAPPERVFKTLVVSLDGRELAVGVVPVNAMLDLKFIAKAAGAKKAEMATKSETERSTGYVLGGVSPLGQKKRLRTFIDSSAELHRTIFVSAGKRGLDMELNPDDLKVLTKGLYARLCRLKGQEFSRAEEEALS